ncbi:MAG: molybdopterin molybdotransferase MoeA [Vicingaceae bacterium]|nr:molybdopterin molybdotransferase MoeA [Vicingaceae bacterium]
MITVKDAQKNIIKNTALAKIIEVDLSSALGSHLAVDLYSPHPIPFFNQSAVDGYAFNFNQSLSSYTVVEKIPAGDTRRITIKEGEAARIFTGSKVPDGCDTVIMQEFTDVNEKQLYLKDNGLKKGSNVRTKGYQLEKGALALKKGTRITPATIGFLATLGFTTIKIHAFPSAHILVTGSELVKPGKSLKEGQIFESNSAMLEAGFNQLKIHPTVVSIKDNLEATTMAIREALEQSDVLVLSGGISVGDYDFVYEALMKNGVEAIFYKVNQKPGKPLFFGTKEHKVVFALPGNPAAALNCFYEYVYPCIRYKMGNESPFLPVMHLPVSETILKKEGRAHFYKAITDFKTVTPLGGQNSDALQSFVWANCLLFIKEGLNEINTGDLVEVHLLP